MKTKQILINEFKMLNTRIDEYTKDLIHNQHSENEKKFIQEDIDWAFARQCEVKIIYNLLFGKEIKREEK